MAVGTFDHLATPPTIGNNRGLGAYNDHIYLLQNRSTPSPSHMVVSRYSIANDSWEEVVYSDHPSDGGLGGIWGFSWHLPTVDDRLYNLAEGKVYHVGSNMVTDCTPVPSNVGVAATRLPNSQYIYVIPPSDTKAFFRYNTVTDTYTALPDRPTNRNNQRIVAYKGKVYLHGGGDGFGSSAELWAFDIAANKWGDTRLNHNFNADKYSHALWAVDDAVYVGGGAGSSWYQYIISTDSWTAGTITGGPTSQVGSNYVQYKGYCYVLNHPASGRRFSRFHATEAPDMEGFPFDPDAMAFSDVDIEIELPEFKPPALHLPRRGEFQEDSHKANLRALENWANRLDDDNVHVWPDQWEKPVEGDR